MTLLGLLQIVHVVSGSLWLGGFLFVYLILWPSLVKKSHDDAMAFMYDLKRPITLILGAAGIISIVLGLVRGIAFGTVNSFQALSSPYGRTFLAAILISILMLAFGKVYGHNLPAMVWKNGAVREFALLRLYGGGVLFLLMYAALILCMVAMRFGGI